MRALLNPVVVTELGLVMFRPGVSLLPYFRRGRILLENEPERLAGMPNVNCHQQSSRWRKILHWLACLKMMRCCAALVALMVWKAGLNPVQDASGHTKAGTQRT